MNKQQMINEARDYLARAFTKIVFDTKADFVHDFAIAEFLINKLEYIFDYDFIEENETLSSEYAYCVEQYKHIVCGDYVAVK